MKKFFLLLLGVCVLGIQTTHAALPDFTTQVFPWLQTAGLTKYSNTTDFRGDDMITRGEAAKFVTQYAQAIKLEKSYTSCSFTDLEGYDETLIPFISQACAYGLLKGSNGKFMPHETVTEAQALAIVMRSLGGFLDETSTPWYRLYYNNGQDLKIIDDETLESVGTTKITRTKFGSRFFIGAKYIPGVVPEDTASDESKKTVEANKTSTLAELKLTVSGVFPRRVDGRFGGFGVRFSTNDINETAINPVVQGSVPEGYCVEFISDSVPLDFAYVRLKDGKRISYHEWIKSYEYGDTTGYKVIYCGVTDFKILLPKDPNFFSAGFGVGLVNLSEEQVYPACTRLVFSADNAQYDETAFCMQKQVGEGEGFVRVTLEDGVKNGLVKVEKL